MTRRFFVTYVLPGISSLLLKTFVPSLLKKMNEMFRIFGVNCCNAICLMTKIWLLLCGKMVIFLKTITPRGKKSQKEKKINGYLSLYLKILCTKFIFICVYLIVHLLLSLLFRNQCSTRLGFQHLIVGSYSEFQY